MSDSFNEVIGMATGYLLFAGYSASETVLKLVESHDVEQEMAERAVEEVQEATLR